MRRGLLVGALIAISAAGVSAGLTPDSTRPYNLVVFVVNCLAKSHLSLYEKSAPPTPHLNRFARDAYVFTNLISPTPFTPIVINELFRSRTFDHLKLEGIAEYWQWTQMIDHPIGRFLEEQGYAYFHERLPEDASRPFVSYLLISNPHFPYDPFRSRRAELPKRLRPLYDRLLVRDDAIRLVQEASDTDAFPALVPYLTFGVRDTLLPVGDRKVWDGILASLKETGHTPAAAIAAGLPAPLKNRLGEIVSARELTLDDKGAIVDALNRFVRERDSPIGDILFGPESDCTEEGMALMGGERVGWWDCLFAFDIALNSNLVPNIKSSPWPPFLRCERGRLVPSPKLTRVQRDLLRKIYRETLEYAIPALSFHHTQKIGLNVLPGKHEAWRNSSGYEDEIALLRALYDADIADCDKQFGACLKRLRRLGVLDNTIIVFMGDHGEAFMEHGYLEHVSAKCYDEVINPPLVIRSPGRLNKSRIVDSQLRIADVLPTALDLMGLASPPEPTDDLTGRSMVPAMEGLPMDVTAFSRDVMFSRSIRKNNGWKYIWDMETNHRELYDRRTDPAETRNLLRQFPEMAGELENELRRYLFDSPAEAR